MNIGEESRVDPENSQQGPRIKNPGTRKHIDYDAKVKVWDFLLSSYRGGMGMQGRSGQGNASETGNKSKKHGYYPGLYRWRKENSDDYLTRVALTPYRPYCRRIVKSFANYATKTEPERKNEAAFADFIQNTDMKGTGIASLVRHVLVMTAVLGEYNVLVDMPIVTPETPLNSRRDEQERGLRPYCVPLMPQAIVDYALDETGKYSWVLIESSYVKNTPDMDKAMQIQRRTFWDSEVFEIYEHDTDKKVWTLVGSGTHPVGRVPVIRFVHEDIDNDPYTPESWFYDLADLNRAIYNLDSIDLANFPNQCFGQLILPGRSVQSSEDARIASASEAWTEIPDEAGISRYIQTNGTEHDKVEQKILSLRYEMYRIAGLQHRTDSKEAESAEAKQWDFSEVEQFLAAFAEAGERIENGITALVAAWSGASDGTGIDAKYTKTFAIQVLADVVAAILDLKQIGYASETGRKEAVKKSYRLLLPDIPDDTMKTIEKEVDESEEPDPLAGFTTATKFKGDSPGGLNDDNAGGAGQ